ncbi:MAG: J domain-containing protein [Noviherbaspirillum sp.]
MAHIHTHYDNLKVARNAPPEVIRAAYKTLSQKYHPDRHGNSPDAIRVIQIINAAYAVLSDPVRRREHDEWIARTEAQPPGSIGAEFMEPAVARRERKPSRRRRRRALFDFSRLQYKASRAIAHSLHKIRMMLDHFSRKLFGKT